MNSNSSEPLEPRAPSEEELGVVAPMQAYRKSDMWWIGAMGVIATSRVGQFINPDWGVRDQLPEPFDAPDHIGNTAVTFVLVSRFADGYWGKDIEAMTDEEYSQRRKKLAIGVGVFTVAANIFAEKVGYGSASTPDVLDFAYGCIGGYLGYRAKRPDHIPAEEINKIVEADGPESRMSKMVQHIRRVSLEKRKSMPQRERSKRTEGELPAARPKIQSSRITNGEFVRTRGTKRNQQKAKMQRNSRKQNRKNR